MMNLGEEMNTHDIELPPLPPTSFFALRPYETEYTPNYSTGEMMRYARAAVKSDRQRRGEPVAWPEAVEAAKADALTVFAESCNHTKEGIEYMAAALIHTHTPQPAEMEQQK